MGSIRTGWRKKSGAASRSTWGSRTSNLDTGAARRDLSMCRATNGSSRTCWPEWAESTRCCSSSPPIESIKPQTREHFDICRLLGIRRGIIALTKADLVDADILGLVRLEVEEFVAGSFLEGAPIVPVSSVTGAGLDELRRELARVRRAWEKKNAADISGCRSTACFR